MGFNFMAVNLATTGYQEMDNEELFAAEKTRKNAISKSAGFSEGDS